jgi:hypothetical protein
LKIELLCCKSSFLCSVLLIFWNFATMLKILILVGSNQIEDWKTCGNRLIDDHFSHVLFIQTTLIKCTWIREKGECGFGKKSNKKHLIGGGNGGTRRKPSIYRKSLIKLLSHNVVSSKSPHERGSNSQL